MKKKLTPFNGLWIKGERRGTGLLIVSRLLRSARTAGKGRSTTCRTTAFSVTVARNATPNFPTRRTQFVEVMSTLSPSNRTLLAPQSADSVRVVYHACHRARWGNLGACLAVKQFLPLLNSHLTVATRCC